jgi:hypothetical protein
VQHPAAVECCCIKKEQQRRKQNFSQQVPADCNFTSKRATPGRKYDSAATTPSPEVAKPNDQIVNVTGPVTKTCSTDVEMVTIITTVQCIMTGLLAA